MVFSCFVQAGDTSKSLASYQELSRLDPEAAVASGILGRLARSEAGRDPQTAAALEAQLPPMPAADLDVDALESAPLGTRLLMLLPHVKVPSRDWGILCQPLRLAWFFHFSTWLLLTITRPLSGPHDRMLCCVLRFI